MTNADAHISSAFLLSKEVGYVTFPEVVRVSSGFNVIPFEATDGLDKDLMRTLSNILNRFLKTFTNTKSRLQGKRVNEVGRRIEELLVNELNKQSLSVKKLGNAGYPDIEIIQGERTIYLEMKTSSSPDENSSFRYFYYTNGKKIKRSAKHLLLDIAVSEESPYYWKIEKWGLSDLSRLRLRLKCEFNASKSDLLDREARLVFSQQIDSHIL